MIKITKSKEELKSLQEEFFNFVDEKLQGTEMHETRIGKWFVDNYHFFGKLTYREMCRLLEGDYSFENASERLQEFMTEIKNENKKPKENRTVEVNKFNDQVKAQYDRIFKLVKKGQPFSYWLSTALDVRVCPYCNRTYTFTAKRIGNKPLVRPQFDHFFDKATHPYFALSFWNFIPSCPICNHVKGNKELKVYPYEEDFGAKKFKIPVDAQLNPQNDFRVEFKGENEDADHDIQVLGLEELYKQHDDYSREIYWKAQAYNEDYYALLETSLGSQLGLSKTEMNRIIFGNYTSEGDLGKRPLAKLTKDLLEQFDVKL
jgi:rubrerythrin